MYAYIPEATSLLFINLFSEKSTCLSLLIEIFYSIMLCQSILNFNINIYNEHLYNRTSCTKYSSKKILYWTILIINTLLIYHT